MINEVHICDALGDLVPFVRFKKREKHSWRSVNFSKLAETNCHKWWQIAQSVSYFLESVYRKICFFQVTFQLFSHLWQGLIFKELLGQVTYLTQLAFWLAKKTSTGSVTLFNIMGN